MISAIHILAVLFQVGMSNQIQFVAFDPLPCLKDRPVRFRIYVLCERHIPQMSTSWLEVTNVGRCRYFLGQRGVESRRVRNLKKVDSRRQGVGVEFADFTALH